MKLQIFCIAFLALTSVNGGELKFAKHSIKSHVFGSHYTPLPVKSINPKNIEEVFFAQRLDHFNFQDDRTFTQRLWIDSSNATTDGPAFIYIAADALHAIDSSVLTDLNIRSIGDELGAEYFSIEPRFHLGTRPTDDLTVGSLQFLTIDQTLADYANIILTIHEDFQMSHNKNRKIILYGLDIGASYAIWLRKKYPHLVDGVIAYSPQLNAIVDYGQYYDDVFNALRIDAPECGRIFMEGFDEIDSLIRDGNGFRLQEVFNLFKPVDTSNLQDIGMFYWSILDFFSIFKTHQNTDDWHADCNILLEYQAESDSYLETLGRAFVESAGTATRDFSYSSYVDFMSPTDWNSIAGEGFRQVHYRECVEASFFKTSSRLPDPFYKRVLADFFVQSCNDIFSSTISRDSIEAGNRRTNMENGGRNPVVTNVYITYGGNDPNRFLGPDSDLNPLASVDVVPGEGKYFDIMPIAVSDSPAVITVKNRVFEKIATWVGEV